MLLDALSKLTDEAMQHAVEEANAIRQTQKQVVFIDLLGNYGRKQCEYRPNTKGEELP